MMSEKNVEMLLRVADQIEKEPERHNQSDWVTISITHDDGDTDVDGDYCKTTACIAGWAIALKYDMLTLIKLDSGEIDLPEGKYCPNVGKEILGLSDSEATILFDQWYPGGDLSVPDVLRKFAGGDKLVDLVDPRSEAFYMAREFDV